MQNDGNRTLITIVVVALVTLLIGCCCGLLIGVTGFFRDPEAFRQLEEQVIPALFADRPAGSLIRVWSAGCATGEEAFSLAILLQEQLDKLHRSHTVQIFATDIDSQAILRALIGAAKADGHIDERERALIDGEITKLGGDAELARWFNQELGKPLDPAEVAGASRSPEMAAEMYLASALLVDEESFMERAYLQELARQLQLAPALVIELERQAKQGAPGA